MKKYNVYEKILFYNANEKLQFIIPIIEYMMI